MCLVRWLFNISSFDSQAFFSSDPDMFAVQIDTGTVVGTLTTLISVEVLKNVKFQSTNNKMSMRFIFVFCFIFRFISYKKQLGTIYFGI